MASVTQLSPMLGTKDLARTIDFYTNVLGFTLAATYPESAPTWCYLTSGTASMMFSAQDGAEPLALSGAIYINVDDLDAVWGRVKDAAEIDEAPIQREYGVREFVAHDPNGYHLVFGAAA
jgi:catechol 2,3-dioxygenase-like lactoylglutathione lyase family enzyme